MFRLLKALMWKYNYLFTLSCHVYICICLLSLVLHKATVVGYAINIKFITLIGPWDKSAIILQETLINTYEKIILYM